jgi:hypothetical protein
MVTAEVYTCHHNAVGWFAAASVLRNTIVVTDRFDIRGAEDPFPEDELRDAWSKPCEYVRVRAFADQSELTDLELLYLLETVESPATLRHDAELAALVSQGSPGEFVYHKTC